jgi:hypothetical protein
VSAQDRPCSASGASGDPLVESDPLGRERGAWVAEIAIAVSVLRRYGQVTIRWGLPIGEREIP